MHIAHRLSLTPGASIDNKRAAAGDRQLASGTVLRVDPAPHRPGRVPELSMEFGFLARIENRRFDFGTLGCDHFVLRGQKIEQNHDILESLQTTVSNAKIHQNPALRPSGGQLDNFEIRRLRRLALPIGRIQQCGKHQAAYYETPHDEDSVAEAARLGV